MKKFRLYYDKDREEQWLNEMAEDGWALESFFMGVYTFGKCEPGEYIYQIDLMPGNKIKRDEFKSFLRENGVEIVEEWCRWIFLRKRASEGEFEMYTDIESKLKQYKRIRNFFLGIFGLEIICLSSELNAAVQTGTSVFWGFTLLFICLVLAIGNAAWRFHKKVKELES